MKYLLTFLFSCSFLLFSCSDSDNDIQIEEEINVLDFVKDPVFKAYLLSDIFPGKTEITKKDAETVTEIDVSHRRTITSLDGIQFFTSLPILTVPIISLLF